VRALFVGGPAHGRVVDNIPRDRKDWAIVTPVYARAEGVPYGEWQGLVDMRTTVYKRAELDYYLDYYTPLKLHGVSVFIAGARVPMGLVVDAMVRALRLEVLP
jgi:hypothetical protein